MQGRIASNVDVRVEQRRSGAVSILGLVLVGMIGWAIWQQRQQIFGMLAWVLVPLIVLAAISGRGRDLVGSIFRGVFGLLGGLFRFGGSAARGAVDASGRQRVYDVEIRSFRVVDPSGATHECVLRGDLVGGTLRMGDDVEVHGIRSPRGWLVVRKVEDRSAGTTVCGSVPLGARLARARVIALALAVVAAAAYFGLHAR